jgi:aspartate/methionine/tyrosine aminotransferase
VAAHWTDAVRGVLLATPSNPTGTSIAFDELGRLVDVARRRGGFTLVDEIYLDLSYGRRPRSAVALGDDVLVAGSFSKFFHMTGWRLGWLVVPPALVSTFEKLAQNLFICPSALAQHAALACFEPEAMAVYRQRRDEFQARRDFIVPALRELGFGIPVEPDGAFYVYLDCSAFGADSTRWRPTCWTRPAWPWCPARTSAATNRSATCACRTPPAWRNCTRRCTGCAWLPRRWPG